MPASVVVSVSTVVPVILPELTILSFVPVSDIDADGASFDILQVPRPQSVS